MKLARGSASDDAFDDDVIMMPEEPLLRPSLDDDDRSFSWPIELREVERVEEDGEPRPPDDLRC